MSDDAAKMRARRERAAAWAAQRKAEMEANGGTGGITGGVVASNDVKVELTSLPIEGWVKGDPGLDKSIKDSGEDKSTPPANQSWLNWSHQVVGSVEKVNSARQSESGIRADMVSWKNREGGIQTLAHSYGGHNSAAMQQDEVEKILEDMDEDYRLPRTYEPQGYIDVSRCEIATMEKPISCDNIGYKMLMKMGWKGHGNGLGRSSHGIVDPIPLTSKDFLDLGSRVGVGKIEEENEMHEVATESRNALEAEIQANESEERKKRREDMVLREAKIKEEIKEIVRVFYCEICDKQYSTDGQYQEHLNSYDHHHKKRFAEFQKEHKAMKGGPTMEERQRKEQKRLEREIAARSAAFKAAAVARTGETEDTNTDASKEETPSQNELNTNSAPVKFGFASKPKAKMAVQPKQPVVRPPVMGFGDDSD